jgi:Tol biopolymer transport system component
LGETTQNKTASAKAPEDRLDSWKEIAGYLNRDVTTVQRWEKREGMPVHRHLHDKLGSVYASRAELDSWAASRKLKAIQENDALLAETPAPHQKLGSSHPPIRWKVILPVLMAVAAVAIFVFLWLQRTEYFWRNPIANARFQIITNFEGMEHGAAVSRDGRFVAFLSDRDGRMDVWITQVGSGQFHNLTQGKAPELVNPLIRELGFSPDSSLVTFWGRKPSSGAADISVYAVPALGGDPKLYLEGVAEYDWSHDGSRLAYHTPGAGDPLYVSDGTVGAQDHPIFTALAGLHSHFQLWSPDRRYIYFVQGSPPDQLDIWRIRPTGGASERITSHNSRVTHPVFLDRRTLVYLASDSDGSGPSLYSVDVEHRIPHRLSSGLDRYTSLAASADGRRLVATLASPKRTLWRLSPARSSAATSVPVPISITTGTGFSPRLGPDFLLYVSSTGNSEGIWKVANGTATELWRGEGARLVGGPALSVDGKNIAFATRKGGRSYLYVMQADATNARVVTDTFDLQGSPAWARDNQSLTIAAKERDVTHLFRIAIDGKQPAVFIQEYSTDPTWSPDGRFVLYSGADIGTKFSLRAANSDSTIHPIPSLTLSRGSRRVVFLPNGSSFIMMRGEIEHKDLWLVDLETGAERQLTHVPHDFNISNFDISPDGNQIVLERVQERSNIVLLDLP